MENKIRVVVWNEFRHEKTKEDVRALYPDGLHGKIKSFLDTDTTLEVSLAALDDENCGFDDERLENTDVIIWWGHMFHSLVPDELADKICDRVHKGKLGFIALHSAHLSKPFLKIVGTNGTLSWGRNQREIVWNLMRSHEIAAGIPNSFSLESEELYSEPFDIPQPDALVFGAWYEDGHIFRAGACFNRGAGKVFYFQPGHETCRSFYNPYVQRIIRNAVHWAKPNELNCEVSGDCPHITESLVDSLTPEYV